MATIKSHSDLDQSRKLSEILPLSSADMYYSHEFVNSAGDYYKLNVPSNEYFEDGEDPGSDIPCWSLAALLSVLPKINGLKPILDLEENSIQYTGIDLYVVADNPVDACYKMIIHLHELNFL